MNEYTAPPSGQQTPPAPDPQQGAGPESQSATATSDRFFTWIRNQGITRSQDRWVGGVAGGIARRWKIDPLIARALTVVVLLFTGIGWVAYAAAWALLPEERDGRIHVEELFRGRFDAAYIGIGIFAVVGGTWGNDWFGFPFFSGADHLRWIAAGTSAIISTALVVAIVVFIIRAVQQDRQNPNQSSPSAAPAHGGSTANAAHFSTTTSTPMNSDPSAPSYSSATDGSTPEQPKQETFTTTQPIHEAPAWAGSYGPPQQPPTQQPHMQHPQQPPVPPQPPIPSWRTLPTRIFALIFGLTLISTAAVLVAHTNGLFDGNVALVAGGVALGVLGLGMTLSGVAGRSAGSLGGLVILALLAVGPVAGWSSLTSGTDRPAVATLSQTTWTPTTVESAQRGYLATVGSSTLDLTKLPTVPGETIEIPIRVAAGSMSIIVPNNIPISAEADIVAGTVDWEVPGAGRQEDGLVNRSNFETPAVTDGATPRIHLDLRGAAGSITIEEKS